MLFTHKEFGWNWTGFKSLRFQAVAIRPASVLVLSACTLFAICPAQLKAATITWTGSKDNRWNSTSSVSGNVYNNRANWGGSSFPGSSDTVVFDDTSSQTNVQVQTRTKFKVFGVTITADTAYQANIQKIVFNNSTESYTITVPQNTLLPSSIRTNEIDVNGSGNVTFNGATGGLLADAFLTVSNTASPTITIAGAGTGSLALNIKIQDQGLLPTTPVSVVYNHTGGLTTVTGTNTYTGGTNFQGGVVSISSDTNLGNAGGTVTFSGGTLKTTADITTNRATTLEANATFDVAGGTTLTWSGTIADGSSSNGVIKKGNGELNLSGTNSYTGDTKLNNGNVAINNDNSLGDNTLGTAGKVIFSGGSLEAVANVTSNHNAKLNSDGTINVDGGSTLTWSGTISGGGDLIKTGSGNLDLFGSNTYTGNTKINKGNVVINNDNSLGNGGTVIFNGGGLEAVASVTSTHAAKLKANSTITVDSGATLRWNGVIDESGGSYGINKTGSGTLVFNKSNTYTGNTDVQGGHLINRATLSSALVTVEAGAILSGKGNYNGSIDNFGSFYRRTITTGTHSVGGDFTTESGSNWSVNVDGLNADLLNVTGNIIINGGTLTVHDLSTTTPRGTELTIATASTVTGSFTNLVLGAFTLRYDPADLLLIAGGAPNFGALNLTVNQKNIADMLTPLFTSPNLPPDLDQTILPLLNNLPPGDLAAVLDQLTPEQLAALSRICFSYNNTQFHNLESRLAEIRGGSTGLSVNNLAFYNMDGSLRMDAPLWADAGSGGPGSALHPASSPFTMSSDNPWGFFASGTGQFGNVEGGLNGPGYDFTTGGLTLGADYRIAKNFVLGFATGYAGSEANVDQHGSKVDVNSAKFGFYASYFDPKLKDLKTGWYADSYVGGAWNSYEVKRNINFGGLNRNALGTPDGMEFNTFLGGGYDYHTGIFTLGPTGRLQYNKLFVNGYTETGADSLNLKVNPFDAESLKSSLGVKLAWTAPAWGIQWSWKTYAMWQHEFLDNGKSVSSQFADGAGGSFGTSLDDTVGRDNAAMGLQINAAISNTISVFLGYDAELNADYQSQSINGGVNVAF
ncbi:MAG: autotransporter domain-containing protein [Methylacidiphilales bacterium]|nr:autotransporter domain-containing protein [Candidatus Methylacidiphilales bacterium]